MTPTRNLWMRVGITFNITEEEERAIFNSASGMEDVIRKLIKEKRCKLDGDTYIPAQVVEDYNFKYETEYAVIETDCLF